MTQYIALLRGINVGGKRMKMANVREMFTALGYANVQSILASGNVIFESDKDESTIITQIEAAIVERFGFESKIVLRTVEGIQSVIDHAQFTDVQLSDDNRKFAHVVFLSNPPIQADVDALLAWHEGNEVIHWHEKHLYIYYTDGSARSKLTTKVIEKYLGVIATARNWKTTYERILPAMIET